MTDFIPPTWPLKIYQGDSVEFSIRVRARTSTGGPGPYYDLTGSTPKAQIRLSADDLAAVEFTVTIGDQVTERGKMNLSLTHTQTSSFADDVYVWDVQTTWPDGGVTTFLRGPVTIIKEITR